MIRILGRGSHLYLLADSAVVNDPDHWIQPIVHSLETLVSKSLPEVQLVRFQTFKCKCVSWPSIVPIQSVTA